MTTNPTAPAVLSESDILRAIVAADAIVAFVAQRLGVAKSAAKTLVAANADSPFVQGLIGEAVKVISPR